MASREQYNRELAFNLVETLGVQRARHVAVQYGWHAVAAEIAKIKK